METHAYLLFKLFSLRLHTTDHISLVETLERLYQRGIITKTQIQLLNDYLSGYTIEEIQVKYQYDILPYLQSLFNVLASTTGYSDYRFIKSFVPEKQSKQAETEMRFICDNYNYPQRIA